MEFDETIFLILPNPILTSTSTQSIIFTFKIYNDQDIEHLKWTRKEMNKGTKYTNRTTNYTWKMTTKKNTHIFFLNLISIWLKHLDTSCKWFLVRLITNTYGNHIESQQLTLIYFDWFIFADYVKNKIKPLEYISLKLLMPKLAAQNFWSPQSLNIDSLIRWLELKISFQTEKKNQVNKIIVVT